MNNFDARLGTRLKNDMNAASNEVERAEYVESIVQTLYDWVKFNTSQLGAGIDDKDTLERQSLAPVVDAAKDHTFNMRELKLKGTVS